MGLRKLPKTAPKKADRKPEAKKTEAKKPEVKSPEPKEPEKSAEPEKNESNGPVEKAVLMGFDILPSFKNKFVGLVKSRGLKVGPSINEALKDWIEKNKL